MKKTFLRTALVTACLMALFQPASAVEHYCREYTKTINVEGIYQNAYGTACRQPDGSWQIVSENEAQFPEYVTTPVQPVIVEQVPVPVYPQVVYIERPRPFFNFGFSSYSRHYDKTYHRGYHKHRDKNRGRGHGRGHGKNHGKNSHKRH